MLENPIAERIKQQLAKLTIDTDDGRQIRVTASMGIAQVDPQLTDLDRILTAADEAMYRAKNEGGNCIRVYS